MRGVSYIWVDSGSPPRVRGHHTIPYHIPPGAELADAGDVDGPAVDAPHVLVDAYAVAAEAFLPLPAPVEPSGVGLCALHSSGDGQWAVPRRAVLEPAAVPPPTDFVVLDPTSEPQPIALPSTTLPRMRGGELCSPPARLGAGRINCAAGRNS